MPGSYKGLYYPLHYRYRPRSGRNWILNRMSILPKNKQLEVAIEYERIYMSISRDKANSYLNELYLSYKDE